MIRRYRGNALLLFVMLSGIIACAAAAQAQAGWVCTEGKSSLQKYRIEGDRLLTTGDAYSIAVGPRAWQIVVNNEIGLVAIQAASTKHYEGTYASVLLIEKESGRFRHFGASSSDGSHSYDEGGTCVPD